MLSALFISACTLHAPSELAIELPAGPLREAWARVDRTSSVPLALPADVLVDLGHASASAGRSLDWNEPETWAIWADLLARAADRARDERAAAGERGWLAVLALEQGRWSDAWRHLEACGADPVWLARLMPRFLPGVREGSSGDALPSGALLAPAPPPPSADVRPGFVDRREAWVRGLKVGEATVDVRIAVEPEGVQVDVVHVAGGSARVGVRLPEPEGFAFEVEYVDWQRQETLGEPLWIEVRPDDAEHSFYGRALPREPEWPTAVAERVPDGLGRFGLELRASADDPRPSVLDAACRAIARLTDVPCAAGAGDRAAEGGIVFAVPVGTARERKLAWVSSAVEAFVLGTRGSPR